MLIFLSKFVNYGMIYYLESLNKIEIQIIAMGSIAISG
jgi:hypothetical protein